MRKLKHKFLNFFRVRTLDRILSGGVRKQLLFLALFALLIWCILFGIAKCCEFGSNDLFAQETQTEQVGATTEELPLWWIIYYHYIDAGSQHQATSSSRWLVMIISFLGSIILTGLLISTISNIIERRIDKYKKGLLRYRFTNHIILFGYNDMTPYLIKQLCHHKKHRHPTIVIQTSRAVEEIRMMLYAELTPKERTNIVFVYARRDMKYELKSLRVHKAKEVFILGESYLENRAEYAHDSLNMDCLNLIGKVCREEGLSTTNRLKCNVLFEYQTTFSAFQFSDISKELKEVIEFYPFNFYENWAQKVFVTGETSDGLIKYQPLDREPVDVDSQKRVHLVIVGMSKMGVAMAVEAAHIAHYPNFRSRKKKTKITLIDIEADKEMDYLKTRYKNLFDLSYSEYNDANNPDEEKVPSFPSASYSHLGDDFMDIEWEFIKGNVADARVQEMISEWADKKSNPNDILTIAICFNYPHTSISCALYLPESVYRNNIPVLVLQRDSSAVINNIAGLSLSEEDQAKMHYQNLRPFGMEVDCFDINTSSLLLAKKVKYVYDFYYHYDIDPVQMPTSEELDKLWYNSDKVANMWSNIYNADSIPTKLRSIGYAKEQWDDLVCLTQEQIDILSEVEHNRWNTEKLLIGFRPPNKNEDDIIRQDPKTEKDGHKAKYIHYDIRPYDMLRADGTGRNANVYDICLTKALPLIIKA